MGSFIVNMESLHSSWAFYNFMNNVIKLDDVINHIDNPPALARKPAEAIDIGTAIALSKKSNQLLLNRSYSPLDCALNGFRYEAIDPDTGKIIVMNESGLRVSVDNGNDTALTNNLSVEAREKRLEDILQLIISSVDSYSPLTLCDWSKVSSPLISFAECFAYGKRRMQELCEQGKIHCINHLVLVYSSSF